MELCVDESGLLEVLDQPAWTSTYGQWLAANAPDEVSALEMLVLVRQLEALPQAEAEQSAAGVCARYLGKTLEGAAAKEEACAGAASATSFLLGNSFPRFVEAQNQEAEEPSGGGGGSTLDDLLAQQEEEEPPQRRNPPARGKKQGPPKRSSLETKAVELKQSIKDLNKALTDATKIRSDEKADNKATLTNASEGLEALKQAITVLKDFYRKSRRA